MNELTYTRCGDYYIPDLKLSEGPGGAGAHRRHAAPHDGGGGRYRGTESPRPHALGGVDEHAEGAGGGNYIG